MSYTSNYSPSYFVKNAHNIPRYGSSPFSDIVNDYQTYGKSVLAFPVALIVLGILSVIIFQLLLMFRCCCKCIKYKPDSDAEASDPEKAPWYGNRAAWVTYVVTRRRVYTLFFVAVVCMAFVADFIIFNGNTRLTNGARQTMDSLTTLQTTFNEVLGEVTLMQTSSNNAQNYINLAKNGNCDPGVSSYIDAMNSAITSLNNVASPLPSKLDLVNSYLQSYAIEKKNLVVFIFFAVIAFVCVMFAIGGFCAQRWLLQIFIGLTELIVIALTVICCILMVFVEVLGDFCMDPTGNVLSLLPSGTLHDTVQYYSTCTGTNTFSDPINQATQNANHIINQIKSSPAYNQNNNPACMSNLNSALNATSDVVVHVNNVLQEVSSCMLLAPVWDGIVNQSLCGNLFSGFYIIWNSQFVTAGGLFFSCCVAAVLYQYFDADTWHLQSDGTMGANWCGMCGKPKDSQPQAIPTYEPGLEAGTGEGGIQMANVVPSAPAADHKHPGPVVSFSRAPGNDLMCGACRIQYSSINGYYVGAKCDACNNGQIVALQ